MRINSLTSTKGSRSTNSLILQKPNFIRSSLTVISRECFKLSKHFSIKIPGFFLHQTPCMICVPSLSLFNDKVQKIRDSLDENDLCCYSIKFCGHSWESCSLCLTWFQPGFWKWPLQTYKCFCEKVMHPGCYANLGNCCNTTNKSYIISMTVS